MSEWRALVAGVAALLVGGCSLLVSTDGLSSPAADAGPIGDGGIDATGAEGGVDAAADADAGPPPPFCASRSPTPTFCADFDTGTLTQQTFEVAGTPTLDTTQFKSPSRSLACVIESGATIRFCSVSHGFGTTPSSVAVAFQARLDEFDPKHGVEMATFRMARAGGGSCNVGAAIRDGEWVFDQYCESGGGGAALLNVTTRSNIAAAVAGWNNVAFTVSFVAPRLLSMTIDGQKALDAIPLDPAMAAGSGTIKVGLVYVQVAAGRARAHIDDLTVDLR